MRWWHVFDLYAHIFKAVKQKSTNVYFVKYHFSEVLIWQILLYRCIIIGLWILQTVRNWTHFIAKNSLVINSLFMFKGRGYIFLYWVVIGSSPGRYLNQSWLIANIWQQTSMKPESKKTTSFQKIPFKCHFPCTCHFVRRHYVDVAWYRDPALCI